MSENISTQLNHPKRNLPRDVFLHLFAIVTLYWSAVSFIALCWQLINNYFLTDLYGFHFNEGIIRFSVASLMIMFPLFIFATWYLNKIYNKEWQVRESKIRKWLIYLTLFIASLIIITDLVTVIYNFLGGEITTKFILKALTVLFAAGMIFGYYLDDIKKPAPSKLARYFLIITALMILASIISAFVIIGSPGKARLTQYDNQKIQDLIGIQNQIVNYWQRKGTIPDDLTQLADPISGYAPPIDRQLNQSYEYKVIDSENLIFELCANFNLSSRSNFLNKENLYYPDFSNQNWKHEAGRTCFERKIDKQLYPFFPK